MFRKIPRIFSLTNKNCTLILLVTSCNLPLHSQIYPTNQPIQNTPTKVDTKVTIPKLYRTFQISIPLFHEWIHNLDWALYNIIQVNDIYQFNSPDWANWDAGDWPGCDQGETNPLKWFPSIDYCEWDPDWIDCNNESSAGTCIHASESIEKTSWYEHVISTHYPRDLNFNGNFCQDERMDWGETGIDVGGSCP